MREKHLPIVGNFMRKNIRGRVTSWVPVKPLSPSLSLIEHGKGTFFLAARKYSCYFFHIPTFRFTGNSSDLQENSSDLRCSEAGKRGRPCRCPHYYRVTTGTVTALGCKVLFFLFPQTNPLSPWENRIKRSSYLNISHVSTFQVK